MNKKAKVPKFAPLVPDLFKVSAKGKILAADAKKWAAVYDKVTGLLFGAELKDAVNWKGIGDSAKVKLCGHECRAANDREVQWVVDRSRHSPAFDSTYFRFPSSGWIWTATPWAGSPGSYAWGVGLGSGNASIDGQNGYGLVLPVCGPLVLPGQ